MPIQSDRLIPVTTSNLRNPSGTPPFASAVRLISRRMCSLSIHPSDTPPVAERIHARRGGGTLAGAPQPGSPPPTGLAPMPATATATPTAGPILAIDLGRYKSVACAHDPATRAAPSRALDTGRAGFGRPFRAHPGARVVVEA